jgi:cobalamin biosynthesis protein CobD/CbiB
LKAANASRLFDLMDMVPARAFILGLILTSFFKTLTLPCKKIFH